MSSIQKYLKSEKLRNSIKLHEGYREKPYVDSRGNLTIYWGHKVKKDEIIRGEVKLPDPEKVFDLDLMTAINDFIFLYKDFYLLPSQERALIELCFNMGRGNLKKFEKMNQALYRGDDRTAGKDRGGLFGKPPLRYHCQHSPQSSRR